MKHEIMRRRDDHSPAAVTRRLAGFLVIGVLASSCGHVGNGLFPSPSGSSVSLSPAATATVDPANLAYAQLLHDPYFSMYVGFRAAISPCLYLDLHLCRVKDQQVISDGQHLQEVLAGVTPPGLW